MNLEKFDLKKNALSAFPSLSRPSVKTFLKIIREMPDQKLEHINPLRFAVLHRHDAWETIDLFLHGVKAGLFTFDFNSICPGCGGFEHASDLSLIAPDTVWCATCSRPFATTLDDQVEVAFTLKTDAGRQAIDPLENAGVYFASHFTGNWERPQELQEFMNDHLLAFQKLPVEETVRVSFPIPKSPVLRLLCMENHRSLDIPIENGPDRETVLDLEMDQGGFTKGPRALPPGNLTLVIKNLTPQDVGLAILGADPEKFSEITNRLPIIKHPYLTVKQILNRQTFRDLFRSQELDPALRLNLKSLTLVFTDLKGSTDMYARVGDTQAYNAVRDHFAILYDVVRRNQGAVVKTMGDAVMATFNSPAEGFQAGLDMVSAVKKWNAARNGGEKLGLKVGIHEGATIAVSNDDRVDFFGQTVNVAARVQGLAEAGEVWLTESIRSAPGVETILKTQPFTPEKKDAFLKGVAGPTTVYRLAT